MKYSNAQLARHLKVESDAIMETGERADTGETVVILTDYRKFVIPAAALSGKSDAPKVAAQLAATSTHPK